MHINVPNYRTPNVLPKIIDGVFNKSGGFNNLLSLKCGTELGPNHMKASFIEL